MEELPLRASFTTIPEQLKPVQCLMPEMKPDHDLLQKT